MGTISTTCNGTYGSHYHLYLDYTLNSQSVANNTSNITLHMYAQADSSSYGAYNLNGSNPYSISINGSTVTSGTESMDFRSQSVVSLGTYTGNVSHNSDGSLTISIGGSFSISGASSLSGGSISGSWTLPTIPRASTISSLPSFNVGGSFTVAINAASSSFTHTLSFTVNGTAIAARSWSAGTTSASITFTQSEYNVILNAVSAGGTSVTVVCTLSTYNGGTLLGTSSNGTTAYTSASTISSFSNFTIGSSVTAGLNIAVPSFTHTLEVRAGSTSLKTVTGVTAGSTDVTPASTDLYNQITSGSTSVPLTLYVTTYYGSKQIGSTVTSTAIASMTPSTVTAFSAFTIGNNISVTLANIGTTNLSYTLTLSLGGTIIATRTSGLAASYTLALSAAEQNALYAAIPNATSAAVTISIATYYSSTQLGSASSMTATATVGSSIAPTLTSITAAEQNSSVSSLVGRYVQNLSKIQLTLNGAAAGNGAAISSYNINFNGVNYPSQTASTGTINTSGTLTATATVTDSRGRTAQATLNVTILPYSVPNITGFTLTRCNSDGTANTLGTYVKVLSNAAVTSLQNTSSAETNTLTYNIYTRARGTIDWGTAKLSKTISGLTLAASDITSSYAAASSFDFRLDVIDKFNTTITTAVLSTSQVAMSWTPTGVGIGKILENGILDVAGDTYIGAGNSTNGNLSVAGTVTSLSAISGTQLKSTIATGTAPLVVSSTTKVANLNADLLDNLEASQFLRSDTNTSLTGQLSLSDSGSNTINSIVINAPNAQGTDPASLRGIEIRHSAAGGVQIGGLRGSSYDDYFVVRTTKTNASDWTEIIRAGNGNTKVTGTMNVTGLTTTAGLTSTSSVTISAAVNTPNIFLVGNSLWLNNIDYNHAGGQVIIRGNWATSGYWGIGPATNASDATLQLGGTSDGINWSTGAVNLLLTGGLTASGGITSAGSVQSNGVAMGNGNEIWHTGSGGTIYINYRGGGGGGLIVENGAAALGPLTCGSLSCSGSKSALVTTQNFDEVYLYADESPVSVFNDRGHGVIDDNGLCFVYLDEVYLETVTTKSCDYYVQLTGYTGSQVEIYDKQFNYFVVSGAAGKQFDWQITSDRKGYERLRFNQAAFDCITGGDKVEL